MVWQQHPIRVGFLFTKTKLSGSISSFQTLSLSFSVTFLFFSLFTSLQIRLQNSSVSMI
jgi:hypothetical protein